ncbi:TVP38/TMEM64 family protein [Shouchella patagoniensis]|uniref:TVP38/TMEM64 family protein n=1 Tax=Shouchella patagoniensis TaxID=228576 RepID=UPI000995D3C1|nr:VTT domain-containing protein [Shouchella patagoniensis]
MILKLVTVFLVVVAIVYVLQSDLLIQLRADDASAQLLDGSLPSLLFISFLFMAVQAVVTVIPLALILFFNYLLFDFWTGYAWSLVTSILGSTIAFYLYRFWLHTIVEKKVSKKWMLRLESRGFWVVLTSRLIPVMPTSLINLASGSSGIRFRSFFSATFIGNALYLIALFLLMEGLVTAEFEWILFSVVAIVAVAVLFRKRLAGYVKGIS